MALKDNRLVKLGLAVKRRYDEDAAGYLASAVAYHAFLSVFPLLLLGLALVGYLFARDAAAQMEWVNRLSRSVPGLEELITDSLRVLVKERTGAGLLGVVGLAWTGIGVVEAAGHALGRVFRIPQYGFFLKKKAWSIASLFALGLPALAAMALTGTAAGLNVEGPAGVVLALGAVLLGFILDLGLFLLAYRILIQRRGPRFIKLWKGAVLAAGGWTALKLVGAWFARRVVANAAAVYGSFAAVIGVLLLLHLASRFFLYGAELNAVIIKKELKGRESSTATEAEKALVKGT